MKFSKTLFVVVLLTLSVALAACVVQVPAAPAQQPAQEEAAAPAEEAAEKTYEDLVVGFAQIGAESEWRTAETESIKSTAEELGVELKFSDAQQKQENQIKAVRNFIAQGVDVIGIAPVVASGWKRGDGNLLVMVFNDSDKPDACRLKIDFAKYGFKSGAVTCRDYGAAGLGYPDSIFMPEQDRRSPPHYIEPDEIAVKEFSVKDGADIPVEVKEHSYRLMRYFQ